jgi:hypothetical protein
MEVNMKTTLKILGLLLVLVFLPAFLFSQAHPIKIPEVDPALQGTWTLMGVFDPGATSPRLLDPSPCLRMYPTYFVNIPMDRRFDFLKISSWNYNGIASNVVVYRDLEGKLSMEVYSMVNASYIIVTDIDSTTLKVNQRTLMRLEPSN